MLSSLFLDDSIFLLEEDSAHSLLPQKQQDYSYHDTANTEQISKQPHNTKNQTDVCAWCSFGRCDIRVLGCGCTMHARCTQIIGGGQAVRQCPHCFRPSSGLLLMPLEPDDDDLQRPIKKRRKKYDTDASLNDTRRTGRWSHEEMTYVDELVDAFEKGSLPLVDDTKLFEFLARMLHSKPSRLTKKRLGALRSDDERSQAPKTHNHYVRSTGYFSDVSRAQRFSAAEEALIRTDSALAGHLRREWRRRFYIMCMSVGQPLHADDWVSSVEERERASGRVRNAARVARTKLLTEKALEVDCNALKREGVFVDKTEMEKDFEMLAKLS